MKFFNGNPVFNIMLFVPCLISVIDFSKKRKSKIKVIEITSELRHVLSIDDITLHGRYWELMKSFISVIEKHIVKEGSLKKYFFLDKIPKDKKYVQIAQTRGNVDVLNMVGKDFYTIISNDLSLHKGIEKCSSRAQIYCFSSEKEQENFLKYLQTDFSRLCLSIAKINQGMGRFELYFVPWLDFTKEWDDEKLFNFFGYPKGHPIREYAKTFLPDYHNLYPNGKTY